MLVSHPLEASPSQLAKPALQVPRAHIPPAHVAAALGKLHARPHAPQWDVLVASVTSQPSAGFMLQSAKPVLHAPTAQRPIAQAPVPLGGAHADEHDPQWEAVVLRSTSHPLVASPSQLAKPMLHTRSQRPAVQSLRALGRAGHAVPHAPQWLASDWVLTPQPLEAVRSQSAKVPVQLATAHMPFMHADMAFGALQRLSHAPQCERFDEVSTQPPAQQV